MTNDTHPDQKRPMRLSDFVRWHHILSGHEPIPAINLLAWAQWFETADRRVAETIIGAVRVSTVFLGIAHGIDHRGKPLLFETMVFGGPLDGHTDRCATWDEAEQMHADACARVTQAAA